MKKSVTTIILWLVYILLLGVLLPHTAWAFKNWEPTGVGMSGIVSYSAAFAFEAAIAALTHKLSKHIESTPRGKRGFQRFSYRYLNPFAFGLIIVTAVSALANLAHAVEFGRSLKIFAEWGIPAQVYSLAFGGILPLVSLVFARVLSNVVDDEEAPNPELETANKTIAALRKQVHDTEQRVKDAEQQAKDSLADSERKRTDAEERAKLAEERFGAMGDIVRYLFGEDKRQRIVFARQQWKGLPNSAIAILTETSPSYVSEVLNTIEVSEEV